MITVNTESREYPLFNSVNRSIRDARQFETINPTTRENVHTLVNNLVRQGPNRLYFATDGRFCWVLMFSEDDYPYQVRIETVQILDEQPQLVRREDVRAISPAALEEEIKWWRRQWGMSGDLIEGSTAVLQSKNHDNEFIHLAGPDLNPFYYRYSIGTVGPRLLAIGRGTDYQLREDEEFTIIPAPPKTILEYSHPFPVNR